MTDPALSPSRLPRSLRALRHRNFRLYWSGQIVSQAGTWMQITAQSWLVYRLTDSPLMLGLVPFVALIPALPVSLLAGVLSDRFPRRSLILLSESVLLVQALVLGGLTALGAVRIWHVILLGLVQGVASALEQPARLAFVADTVGKEDLPSAVALNSAVYNVARIAGPSIAGLLVLWVGEAGCFFVNSASFLAIILALLAIRLPPAGLVLRPAGNLAGGLVDGFRYVWTTHRIRGLMVVVAVASFLTLPYVGLMPVFARDVLQSGRSGPGVLGFLMTGVGVGAIAGALGAAGLREGRRGLWLAWGNVVGPLLLIPFCLSGAFPLSLGLVVLVGASNAVRQTLANSLIQLNTAEAYHGRVMSIFSLLFTGMSQAGTLAVGGVAEVTGAPWAVGASAVLSVLFGLLFLWRLSSVHRLP